MSAHLDQLGVEPEDRGAYMEHVRFAHEHARAARALVRHRTADAGASRIGAAAVALRLELDRLGAPAIEDERSYPPRCLAAMKARLTD